MEHSLHIKLIAGWVLFLIMLGLYWFRSDQVRTLSGIREEMRKRLAGAKEYIEAANTNVNEMRNMIVELVDKHEEALESQANIADANIKRYRDEVATLKDRYREGALNKAIDMRFSDDTIDDVVEEAEAMYKYLIGK